MWPYHHYAHNEIAIQNEMSDNLYGGKVRELHYTKYDILVFDTLNSNAYTKYH